MLREDGVSLDEFENEAVTEDGHVERGRMLTRYYQGRVLSYPLSFDFTMDDPVPRYMRRRIANSLRLPAERYILPDE